MVTKEGIRALLGFLVLLFSIEDLIGNNNITRLEEGWLGLSKRIFLRWQTWLQAPRIWWGYLLLYSFLVLLPLLTIAGITWGTTLFFDRLAQYGTCVSSLSVIPIGLGCIISWIMLTFITDFFVSISSGEDSPLEIRILRSFSKISTSDSPWLDFLAQTERPSMFGLLIPVLLSGIFVPISSIVLISVRSVLLISTLAFWLIFFAPASLFRKLAKMTGATSYIKVGKYLFTLFSYILTYIL